MTSKFRYLTAGESHGNCLTAIVDGLPSGIKIDRDFINSELKRRNKTFGRSIRAKTQNDRINILSGVIKNTTTGAPITLQLKNDFNKTELSEFYVPRPGHADLAGSLKYDIKNCAIIAERASARETAIRTAVGSIAKILLNNLNIKISSQIVNIAKRKFKGDSLGGIFELNAFNVPCGLGSFVHWDKKLDAKIAFALMSIQAVKGVEFGAGFKLATMSGSNTHDEIFYKKNMGFYRNTNNAGGIEGGITNGAPLVIRCVVKPVATLKKGIKSVDIRTKSASLTKYMRSDFCAVPAAAVVGEAVLAIELANAVLNKFGGDSFKELLRNYLSYLTKLKYFQ